MQYSVDKLSIHRTHSLTLQQRHVDHTHTWTHMNRHRHTQPHTHTHTHTHSHTQIHTYTLPANTYTHQRHTNPRGFQYWPIVKTSQKLDFLTFISLTIWGPINDLHSFNILAFCILKKNETMLNVVVTVFPFLFLWTSL